MKGSSMNTHMGKIVVHNEVIAQYGSLTPEHLEITHKASNGLIFLSNFQFTIPRYS